MLAQIATALLAFASHHKLEDAKEVPGATTNYQPNKAAAHSRVGGQTDPALIGWQRLGGGGEPPSSGKPIALATRHCTSEQAHALILGQTGALPSAAGVPPFERCRVGVSGLPPYKERPARRESSLKTRTCRRALHLWAGRADAPMLPPNDISAEASQIAQMWSFVGH